MSDSAICARFKIAWGDFHLDVALQLPSRGVSALFGASGSGKTTVLRCLAGLEPQAQGFLQVRDQVWQDQQRGIFLPAHRRPIGYVFQDARLFPHLSVRNNLEYARKRASGGAPIAIDALVEWLGIAHILERMPERLSGGERQRVAIARALATRPQWLLLDEPLAALDVQRKQEILPYLERLRDELAIPLCYVSHAPDEVGRLADYLVLLDNGRVIAAGQLHETLARIDLPIAMTEDAGVVIEVRVAGHDEDYHLTQLDFPGGSIMVARRHEAVGARLRLRIQARDVSLSLRRAEDVSILNLLPVRITAIAPTDSPAHVLVRLDAGGTPLIARITYRSLDHLQITVGKALWAQVKAVALLS